MRKLTGRMKAAKIPAFRLNQHTGIFEGGEVEVKAEEVVVDEIMVYMERLEEGGDRGHIMFFLGTNIRTIGIMFVGAMVDRRPVYLIIPDDVDELMDAVIVAYVSKYNRIPLIYSDSKGVQIG